MPLKITEPTRQVAVLNKWADSIEAQLRASVQATARAQKKADIPVVIPADIESIKSNVQVGTTYQVQLSDNDTLITLNNNAGGTVTLNAFGVPLQSGVLAFDLSTTTSGSGIAVTTPSLTPALPPQELAVFLARADEGSPTNTLAGGWTAFGNLTNDVNAWQVVSNPIAGSATLSVSKVWSSALTLHGLAGNSLPTVIPGWTAGGDLSTPQVHAMPTSNTAGNQIWVRVEVSGEIITSPPGSFSSPTIPPTISDSNGNTYNLRASSISSVSFIGANTYPHWTVVHFFVAENIKAGSNTVTYTQPAYTPPNYIQDYAGNLYVDEIQGGVVSNPLTTAFPAGFYTFIQNTGTGTFIVQSSTQIDGSNSSISLAPKQGVLVVFDGTNWFTERGFGVSLPVSIINGGTGVSLAATGGTSQVLQQVSVGANITVGQLAASNLSNGVTGSGAVVLATSPTFVTPVLGTPSSGTLTNCTFPTLNQNTTGSAAKWTTARNLAGNLVDGSANVAFSNKFVVQGTTDTGLTGAQFLGALTTGIIKNTTTTGVLSIAIGSDLPSAIPIASVGSAGLSGTSPIAIASTGVISTGIIPIALGGTGVSLAATGGTSQVLKQVSVGANITVGQLAASDLSNGVTGSGAVVLAGTPTLTTPNIGIATASGLIMGVDTGHPISILVDVAANYQGVIGNATGYAFICGAEPADTFVTFQATHVGVSNNVDLHLNPNGGFVAIGGTGANSMLDVNGAITIRGGTPSVPGGAIGIGTTTGFGNGGIPTAVTTVLLGTGSGPTTPQTIIGFLKINVGGTDHWVPYMT